MEISSSVKEAWRVKDGMNKVRLEHLTPDMIAVPTPNESLSVAGYLAHMAGSKKWWLSHLDKEEADRLPDLYAGMEGNFIAEKTGQPSKRFSSKLAEPFYKPPNAPTPRELYLTPPSSFISST